MTLLTRLSKLDAPDREVDGEIDVLFFGGETVWKQANYTMEQFPASKRPSKHHICGYAYECVPAYTASVDAALALIDRVAPNERPFLARITFEGKCQWRALLTNGHTSWSPVAAIALLIALLRAKEASNAQ